MINVTSNWRVPEPTRTVQVLGQTFHAWTWQEAPERDFNVFSRFELHPHHVDQILVLNRRDSQSIENRIHRDALLKSIPVQQVIDPKMDDENTDLEIRAWLYRLGISFQNPVIIWDHNVLLTKWKMVLRYFDVWDWTRDIMIFDDSLQWYLFFDHEERISYANHQGVAS
jgi:hypothetical protein